MTLPPISEKELMAQVKQVAGLLGWEVYHPFLSKWSQRGFPDLTLIRQDDTGVVKLIFIELKSVTGRLSSSQAHWLWLLRQVPGVRCYIWRPHGEYLERAKRALAH